MKRRHILRTLYLFASVTVFVLAMGNSTAWSGSLRIFMTDGTSVDVPYYWKQGGEYKFYMSGGTAGIPENQVSYVQEILNAKAFDAATFADTSQGTGDATPASRREEVLAAQIPPLPQAAGQAAGPTGSEAKKARIAEPNINRPLFTLEGDFSKVVTAAGEEQKIVVRNVLSSHIKLTPGSYKFKLTLYDGEGNKLDTRDCEWQKLNLSRETLNELKARDNMYLVVATIKQDPRIKSYEITAVKP